MVNIETVVTDREGGRVTGLTREDFRLLVDGDEVPIGYFTEIRDGRPTADLPEAEPGASPDTARGETVTAEPIPTNYLVFVDDYFAIGAHRDLVLRGLAEQLSHLGERDRVAVVAYDGSRVVMLVGWTGDTGEIRAGLEAARERPAEGAKRIAEARMLRPRSRSSTGIDGRRPLRSRQHPGSTGPRATFRCSPARSGAWSMPPRRASGAASHRRGARWRFWLRVAGPPDPGSRWGRMCPAPQ